MVYYGEDSVLPSGTGLSMSCTVSSDISITCSFTQPCNWSHLLGVTVTPVTTAVLWGHSTVLAVAVLVTFR